MAKQVLYLSFFPLPFLPERRVGEGGGRGVWGVGVWAVLVERGWHVELTQ